MSNDSFTHLSIYEETVTTQDIETALQHKEAHVQNLVTNDYVKIKIPNWIIFNISQKSDLGEML